MQTPGEEAPRRGMLRNPLPLLLFCALTSLYFSHFRLPFTPIWEAGDQWDVVKDPARMWDGEKIYRDFYEQTTPGVAVVDLLFFRLFGLKNWIPNLHIVLLGIGLTWLVIVISHKIFREWSFLTLLPGFLFLTFAFFPHMEDTHRWYSSAAALAALAVVIETRTLRRLVAVGILCGVASFFTQTQGVFAVAGFGVFLLWDGRRRACKSRELLRQLGYLLGAFAATVIVTDGYFIWTAGLARFFDCVVRIPVLYLSADPANTWHVYLSEFERPAHWYNLPGLGRYLFVYALVPLVYFLFPLRYRHEASRGDEGDRLMLLSIVGLALFASVALAPANFRLCAVSAPAFVVLIYWVRGEGKFQRILAVALWVPVLYLGVLFPLRAQASSTMYLHLPRGTMAFPRQSSAQYELIRWLSSRTEPGDFVLATGQLNFIYPLGLRPVDQTSGYENSRATRPEWVQSAVAALERNRVRFIEWPPDRIDPNYYHPDEDNLAPLKEYVQRNYHFVKRFENPAGDEWAEIWARNE